MKNFALTSLAVLALSAAAAAPAAAQEEAAPDPAPTAALGPTDIVNAAPQEDWVVIAPEDMVVMTLAPDRDGNARQVVIQLMPAPFSQGWVENIRTLARAKWYDGISVNRVQDNYVVQWGDPGHDNPEGEGLETKPLPEGLNVMGEEKYVVNASDLPRTGPTMAEIFEACPRKNKRRCSVSDLPADAQEQIRQIRQRVLTADPYAQSGLVKYGWTLATSAPNVWPVHCYGMVGVGRNYSPDTGSGAELYTVIGHAPRHLDRNIALAGRIISGMEHLSSLPRGSGVLGFYTAEEAGKRTPILSIRVASDLPEAEQPAFEYLSTETETFAAYAEARANRRDPFFIVPAGGADICNIPVPIRPVTSE